MVHIFLKEGRGNVHFATLGLHLSFSAKLRIWQVSACKMEPQSGTMITQAPTQLSTELGNSISTLTAQAQLVSQSVALLAELVIIILKLGKLGI